MPAGAVGAVRPVGAILPTATAAGPFRSRSRGRLRRPEGSCEPCNAYRCISRIIGFKVVIEYFFAIL